MKYLTVDKKDFDFIKSVSYKIKNYNEDTLYGFIIFYIECDLDINKN